MIDPNQRAAVAALDAARPTVARLDPSRHAEEIAADLVEIWSAVETALARGDRAFIIHATGDAHEALLSALSDHGLTIGRDVSVISAAAAFDTTALSTAVDTIPLVPSRSCDLAVEIALRHLEEKNVAPQIHLIPPEYRSTGSVRTRTD